jgi:hypothetical protein
MFRIPKMEIQRILSKVHSLKEIGNSVLSETNVDDIIDGIISNNINTTKRLILRNQ